MKIPAKKMTCPEEKLRNSPYLASSFFLFMEVSTSKPFRIIYSLFEHEFLGYLFESFAVQLDAKGNLTLVHQNISSQNAAEFAKNMDETDFELVRLMDSIQQNDVIKKFSPQKRVKPHEFFEEHYLGDKTNNKLIRGEIERYLEYRRSAILKLIKAKPLYEMGKDGEPTWKEIEIQQEPASVLFHFVRNENNTHYFPTIKHDGKKLDFQYKNAYIICKEPAWMVCDNKLYSFKKNVDGNKLKPFLNKKFIVIPKKMEERYYKTFIGPLVASFDVYARGFQIITERYHPQPVLSFAPIRKTDPLSIQLFSDHHSATPQQMEEEKDPGFLFKILFRYDRYIYKADNAPKVNVEMEHSDDKYLFHRIVRRRDEEISIIDFLKALDLKIHNSRCTLTKSEGIQWISENKKKLAERNILLEQEVAPAGKKYYVGNSSISIEVTDNIDWFDIHAIIKFGDYKIKFKELRKLMLRKKNEILLPNGEVGIIPDSWFSKYSELFAFMEEHNDHRLILKKHHLALVKELESDRLAKVNISKKLEQLRNFESIENEPIPKGFKGKLRPYQKAGFNWLMFLNKYKFGGCLADDMGLGKTVQTLTLLQALKNSGATHPSLLIMPTSLIYNWGMEAAKFTPKLRILNYTGTNRIKDVSQFNNYDLVLTSYGIARLDIDLLKEFYFNYIILDESQAIKNPNSNISRAVRKLRSKNRLILTGTPLENTTLDLWSQMTFINPGLLKSQTFFTNEFLIPIEKKFDREKTKKLNTIIKPFILRRHKSQVAKELPEKVESIKYCSMTPAQEKYYEEIKSYYRNRILDQIEQFGIGKSQMVLLQGLIKLRQIANHPKMVAPDYGEDSGKMEAVLQMTHNAISENHKILIFSQFVKHLSLFQTHFRQMGIPFSYLDGSTKDRQSEVERFQNDESIKVFLISLKAGGLGLNLTRAEYVFLLDPWWNPAVEQQAIDRAHRIGQENRVFIYKFITKNTVEEKILKLQQKKIHLATELITTEESIVKSLKKKDIESLLD